VKSSLAKSIFFSGILLSALTQTVAAELTVFAAASLTDVLKEIGTNYSKQSGDKLSFNFAASSILARQISEGAPADLFLSADEEWMDKLAAQNLLLEKTRRSLLSNTLVVVTPSNGSLEIKMPTDLLKARRIAIAEPKSVPAGKYAKRWLQDQKMWGALTNSLIPTENVRAALAAVESGNADAAIIYRTDAAISKKVRIALEVPSERGPSISYPVAVLRESKEQTAAENFLQYLGSKSAGDIFRKFGFTVLHPKEHGAR
jgi:molybdate transport system substrate-binding protein